MKRFLIYAILVPAVLVITFFVISMAAEFRPDDDEPVTEYAGAANAGDILPDTLKVISWNIGYAGLGDNMDFFMDGGSRVRDTRERTARNLADIISVLKREDADIYLLQEVDFKAHRTYGINEVEALSQAFPGYHVYFAPNFKVWFVPVPLREPIGGVNGGLVILSKVRPQAVRRLQYPSAFPFPMRMFNLKRCLLEADFLSSSGAVVHIGNTHNSAFDTSGMREQEDAFIIRRINGYDRRAENFIVAGDWNQCPPPYQPGREELENEYFKTIPFDTTGMCNSARIICDMGKFTMRYNDRPFDALTSTTSVIDFFLVPPRGMQVLDMYVIDLNFLSSDHNPVCLEAVLPSV